MRDTVCLFLNAANLTREAGREKLKGKWGIASQPLKGTDLENAKYIGTDLEKTKQNGTGKKMYRQTN